MSETSSTVKEQVIERSQPMELALTSITENGNVRSFMDGTALDELARSIKIYGVLSPITVRPITATKKQPGSWQVVAGHRRLAAAKLAGLERIPVIVREMTEDAVLEVQVIENLQREDLHPLDEAEGYYRLVMEHGAAVDRIAGQIGKTRGYIFDRIQLVKLTDHAKQLFRQGRFQVEHAVKLARLAPADQKRALEIPKNDYDGRRAPLFRFTSTMFGDELVAKSAKELQEWIDVNVRLPKAPDDAVIQHLFPETAQAMKAAEVAKLKVVSIVEDHMISAGARDEKDRAFTPATYRPVGKKSCDYQVLGVVVAGSNRGKSYMICTRKDRCLTHWREEIAQRNKAMKNAAKKGGTRKETLAAARRAEQDRYRQQDEENKKQEARWKVALPKVKEAFAHAILGDKVNGGSPIGKWVLRGHSKERADAIVALIGRDVTPEGLLRYAAMGDVLANVHYYGGWHLKDLAKVFGVNLTKVVAEANGDAPAPAKKAKAKAAKKK